MRILGCRKASVSASLLIMLVITLLLIANYGCQNAFACQCSRPSPQTNYERSDVIFVGKVTNTARNVPLEEGYHVTFDVLKSWKGVDTKTVTIHTGDGSSCGSYPFRGDDPEREYIVYGTKNFSEIVVTLWGGTIPMEKLDIDYDLNPFLNVNLDLEYLDGNFVPIKLKAGHTESVNILPPLQILASFVAFAATAFILIRRA